MKKRICGKKKMGNTKSKRERKKRREKMELVLLGGGGVGLSFFKKGWKITFLNLEHKFFLKGKTCLVFQFVEGKYLGENDPTIEDA